MNNKINLTSKELYKSGYENIKHILDFLKSHKDILSNDIFSEISKINDSILLILDHSKGHNPNLGKIHSKLEKSKFLTEITCDFVSKIENILLSEIKSYESIDLSKLELEIESYKELIKGIKAGENRTAVEYLREKKLLEEKLQKINGLNKNFELLIKTREKYLEELVKTKDKELGINTETIKEAETIPTEIIENTLEEIKEIGKPEEIKQIEVSEEISQKNSTEEIKIIEELAQTIEEEAIQSEKNSENPVDTGVSSKSNTQLSKVEDGGLRIGTKSIKTDTIGSKEDPFSITEGVDVKIEESEIILNNTILITKEDPFVITEYVDEELEKFESILNALIINHDYKNILNLLDSNQDFWNKINNREYFKKFILLSLSLTKEDKDTKEFISFLDKYIINN
ncbi:MAG: hypothetical protein PHG82_05080 [Candidatus Gracilibacteria bacterium]|nr:hypothetical protein [Candidatus Gracilibacteria bacterium]